MCVQTTRSFYGHRRFTAVGDGRRPSRPRLILLLFAVFSVFGCLGRFARVNLNAMPMPMPRAAHQPSALPTWRDFLVSPGFAGAAVLIAAVIVFCAVLYASGRAARRLDEQLEQRRHTEAVDRCWDRFVWLVETASIEPAAREAGEASLGLGPDLALELLRGLHHDANVLGDETLARAVSVYLVQYGLVLGRQGGLLPKVTAAPDRRVRSSAREKPSAAATMPMKSRTTVRRTQVRDATDDQSAGTH